MEAYRTATQVRSGVVAGGGSVAAVRGRCRAQWGVRSVHAIPLRLRGQAEPDSPPVGAENPVTSCDLDVLVKEAAEPVSSDRPDDDWGMRSTTAFGRALMQ